MPGEGLRLNQPLGFSSRVQVFLVGGTGEQQGDPSEAISSLNTTTSHNLVAWLLVKQSRLCIEVH